MSASDRKAWVVLALAGVGSAALLLYLNRGGTFFNDELVWFENLGGDNDLRSILMPHNSHLHGTTRLLYLLTMETVGTQYVVFRILDMIAVLLCAGLFFALTKRRVGVVPALVPAIILLFFGSAWAHVVAPIGFTVLFSIAAGLAALIALERDDRRGDVLACGAICLSVFTFTVGLGYLVGAAVSVLLRVDRLRRAWIFLVPLVLYTAWWLWSQQFDQVRTSSGQIDDVLPFIAKSLVLCAGSLTGLNISLDDLLSGDLIQNPPGLGWIPAALVAIAFVGRLVRGNVPKSLWASLGIVVTYWVAAALASSPFVPTEYAVRYVFPGSVGVLLVVSDLGRGIDLGGRRVLVSIAAVGAFSLAVNVAFLFDGARFYRESYTPSARATLAAFELGSGLEPGTDTGQVATQDVTPPVVADLIPIIGEQYLTAVQRYGSPAYTLDDVREQPGDIRALFDEELVRAYGTEVEPAAPPRHRDGCATSSEPIALPAGGALIRAEADGPVTLSRFGPAPGAGVGTAPREWGIVDVPEDRGAEPWLVSAEGELEVCPR